MIITSCILAPTFAAPAFLPYSLPRSGLGSDLPRVGLGVVPLARGGEGRAEGGRRSPTGFFSSPLFSCTSAIHPMDPRQAFFALCRYELLNTDLDTGLLHCVGDGKELFSDALLHILLTAIRADIGWNMFDNERGGTPHQGDRGGAWSGFSVLADDAFHRVLLLREGPQSMGSGS